MRILLFCLIFTLISCGSESSDQSSSSVPNAKSSQVQPNGKTVNYKKTASNSEFAIFQTTSATDDFMEYYFKTLDGIRVKFTVSHDGEPEVKVPDNLLEHAKYLEGYPGANPEMAGKVFELIYDGDNKVGEVKLAKTE